MRRKTRKPLPPLMRASATPRLAVLCPQKKSEGSCPSGLPPPLHPKSAKRSVRDRGAYRPGRRRGRFPFWQGVARSRRFAWPVPRMGNTTRKKSRVRKLVHSPILVYYQVREDKRLVEIFHFRHGSRKPPKFCSAKAFSNPFFQPS